MTFVGTFLFILLCLLFALSLKLVPDPFSPEKFFILSLGIFFSNIFFKDYDPIYYLIWLLAFFSIAVGMMFGAKPLSKAQRYKAEHQVFGKIAINNRGALYVRLLILTIPGIIAQVYLIQLFGGIEGYIGILKNRVLEFHGLGHIKIIIATLSPAVLLYYSVLISDKDAKIRDWLVFLVPLLILIAVGLLSASRGKLLSNFVLIAIIYHYTTRRISAPVLTAIAGSIMLMASVIGVMRKGYKMSDGEIVTGLSTTADRADNLSTTWMSYGLTPIELVIEVSQRTLHFGSTYAAAITNLVPRALWPGKPDSGGVVLTVEYADNRWEGLSYLSTGIFPEAIINFGELGLLVGVMQLVLLVTIMMRLYNKFLCGAFFSSRPNRVLTVVIYAKLLLLAPNFLHGEFANMTSGIIEWIAIVLVLGLFVNFGKNGRATSRGRFSQTGAG